MKLRDLAWGKFLNHNDKRYYFKPPIEFTKNSKIVLNDKGEMLELDGSTEVTFQQR